MTPLTPRAARLFAACDRLFPDPMAIQRTNPGGAHEVAKHPEKLTHQPQPSGAYAGSAVRVGARVPMSQRTIIEIDHEFLSEIEWKGTILRAIVRACALNDPGMWHYLEAHGIRKVKP